MFAKALPLPYAPSSNDPTPISMQPTIGSGRTQSLSPWLPATTMTVELSADQWTNVDGEHSQSGFGEILSQMGNTGVTFGGGCFFGHGTNTSRGNARFVLTRLELKP